MNKQILNKIIILLIVNIFILNTFAESKKILITEFMALNSKVLTDEDGDYSDWIEIYNNTDSLIQLEGWSLTDKIEKLQKWIFPTVSLESNAYMVVFASEKNRVIPDRNLHTNFKLSGAGEYLAICEPDMTVSHEFSPAFPPQRQDVSYGLYHDQYVYFTTATPGAENIAGNIPFQPLFSLGRGFYDSPVSLTLTNPGTTGSIYYTLDGTRPNSKNATLYTSPIQISKTTPVSAVVIDNENVSSDIVTHTYLFINDIINQPKTPAGYPSDWKESTASVSVPADYEMDARVTQSPDYVHLMEASLKSLPTMNIVTNIGYLFSNVENTNEGGIYIFTGLPHTKSKTWVRPTSVEYFDPSTGEEFQLNCQLKLHGGNSRRPTNSPKHGFEIKFKSAYGPPKLNFDFFKEKNSTKEFNSLVLRAGYNNTWAKNDVKQQLLCQYIQDSFAKTTQLDMGHPAAHETFVHLYLNGLYWGVYNVSEELNKNFMSSYLPGKKEDFDVVKEKETTTPTDGNMVAWNSFKSQITGVGKNNANYQKILGKNADGSINPSYQNLLDVDNYIDYMLINYYIGNQDWDANNWTVGRNRNDNTTGFKFFCWDAETSMVNIADNRIITGTSGNPTAFMQYLKLNADFKVRLADKINKNLLQPGGALTPTEIQKRYNKLADEIELAMISESARWSDWFPPYNPYTLNDHWKPRKNVLMNNYFPYRTDTLLNQLKRAALYPNVDAPVFSHPAGNYNESINLTMQGQKGTIYYTTDGTDPRIEIAGTVNTTARNYTGALNLSVGTTVKARIKTGNDWSAITEAAYSFDAVNGIETFILAEQMNAKAYPNPFRNQVEIKVNIPSNDHLQVDVYGLDGRFVTKLFDGIAIFGDNIIEWNASDHRNGVYLCKITYKGKSTFLKLIKNN